MRRAAAFISAARDQERAGCIPEAIEQYGAAIAQAELHKDYLALSEALRRLATIRYQRGEREQARELCNRSYDVALEISDDHLAGEALNTLGAMLMQEGSLPEANELFLRALKHGGPNRELMARVEQNLGVAANIRGDLDEAFARYARSLDQYKSIGDEHGCALAFHNLGMVSADKELFDDADGYFRQSLDIAERAGDVRLQGLCLLNHADVHIARQRFEDARKDAEASLAIFDRLGARDHKASAYRVIGVVYRETGRSSLAESRLRSAIELSVASGSMLLEAEATRELAVLYQVMGRNQEGLTLLNAAHRLFHRLDARIDLINVDGRIAELEGTYFGVVRQWGQSIESSDTYTFGHCERVADRAVAVATALGLDETQQTTIRLGAYLHDVGKVKVPHEILNKPGPLTREEFEVVQMHPVWGIEMLANVEFPWDIKPIIRWHHEKYSGAGYPDRLRGDEIPLSAQIVGIVDVYDAVTTERSYRPAMTAERALAEITKVREAWSEQVYNAFLKVLGA
ncbi:MAG TPA: HD domain-containing phosphohydrolase [Gemmatimonadaceae bacterium]|nr:HD domain-containing phosphohydrolase [Gemmatimonadaceae bacterium]